MSTDNSKTHTNTIIDAETNSIPSLSYSILSNSALGSLYQNDDITYSKDLALALLKAEMEYQEIKSIINLHSQEAIMYIMDSSLSGYNRMAHKDTTNSCIPFKRKSFKIECNSARDSCKCPEGYVPCSHNKTLADYSLWKTAVRDICKGRRREDSIIIGKLFNAYNCDGQLIDKKTLGIKKSEDDNSWCDICESADAILCRRKVAICETTQWFEWSGCSMPCGPGIQKRFRIFLNDKCDGEYSEDTRNCQLAECPQRIPQSSCKFMKLPEKKSNQFMYDGNIYGCNCPIKGYIACSAEEALNNQSSWKDDFLKHKDEYLDSINFKKLISQGLDREHVNHLSSSYRVLMRGGVIVDGSMSWSIASDYDLYWLCRPGAPVLCRENVEYEMVQGASYAQFVFKPDPNPDHLLAKLSAADYSLILLALGVILFGLYIIATKFSIKKVVKKVKNKFKKTVKRTETPVDYTEKTEKSE